MCDELRGAGLRTLEVNTTLKLFFPHKHQQHMYPMEHHSAEPNREVEAAPPSAQVDDPFTPVTFRTLLSSERIEGSSRDDLDSERDIQGSTTGDDATLQLKHGNIPIEAGVGTDERIHALDSDEGSQSTEERQDLAGSRKVSTDWVFLKRGSLDLISAPTPPQIHTT